MPSPPPMPGEKPQLRLSGDYGLDVEPDSHGVTITLQQPALVYYHSFVSGALARRARQPGQALLRACGSKRGRIGSVLDLNAGWGADGFTLACHGRRVTLVEWHPAVYAILEHAWQCLAASDAPDNPAKRMHIVHDQALNYLESAASAQRFDCVYLDPMFPARKSGAKPGKEMQILQVLTANADIEACFAQALRTASKRVVVKRPLKAPGLSAGRPDFVLREKTVRFDVYLTA